MVPLQVKGYVCLPFDADEKVLNADEMRTVTGIKTGDYEEVSKNLYDWIVENDIYFELEEMEESYDRELQNASELAEEVGEQFWREENDFVHFMAKYCKKYDNFEVDNCVFYYQATLNETTSCYAYVATINNIDLIDLYGKFKNTGD